MFFMTPSVGDHVRVRQAHRRIWGSDVRAGAWGIVRETHYGIFSSDVVIELSDGSGRVRLSARNVRSTGGHGESGFELRRDWQKAKLFAGLLLALPILFSLIPFLLAGDPPAQLVEPIIEGAITTMIALVTGPFGGALIVVALLLVVRRRAAR